MKYNKGFGVAAVVVVVAIIAAIGGGVYVANKTAVDAEVKGEAAVTEDNVAGHPEEDRDRVDIAWKITEAGENDGITQSKVVVMINGRTYVIGTFNGNCSPITSTGGIDGKGLLVGELSAVQCWFAGGGDEIGVFAHEDGGVDIMVGELGEGEEGAGVFRGNFKVKTTIENL